MPPPPVARAAAAGSTGCHAQLSTYATWRIDQSIDRSVPAIFWTL